MHRGPTVTVSDVADTFGPRRRLRCLTRLTPILIVAGIAGAPLAAQRGRGQAPPVSPRAAAPVDLTGYWISIVTEDWRWRMVTPAKGDYDSVPLNAAARRAADSWDPTQDAAAGESCRSYGAPAIMRVPGRVHITWDDDATLHIDTEAGTQTRILRFGTSSPPAEATWQGQSNAQWEVGGRGGGIFGVAQAKPSGALKVVTTRIRPGYLRKNGVPYSANAIVTEYFNALPREENGDTWLVVTTVVTDPQFLNGRFITSSHFKRLPDGNAWHPTPCRSS
jgi:hypothetical protein